MKKMLEGNAEYAQAIDGAAPEIDGRSLFEIFRWTTDFTNSEFVINHLR
jgi:hypothetical protein